MPQAIAMQPLVIAAAMPTEAMALASGGSVTGKAPMFAGLLLQLGRMASSSAPTTRFPAIAREATPPSSAGQQSVQPEPEATGQTNETPSTLPAGGQAVAREANAPTITRQQSPQPGPRVTGKTNEARATSPADGQTVGRETHLPTGARQQFAQPKPPTALPTDQEPPTPELALPTVAQPAPSAPASDQPVRQRTTLAANSTALGQPVVVSPADGSAVAASTTPMLTPVPAMPAPTSAPDPPQLRLAPADSRAQGPGLEGMAAKPGPTASGPPQSGTAPAQPDTMAAASTMPASPPWPAAPAAAAAIPEAGAPPVQPAVAVIQSEQTAGLAQVPEGVDVAPAPQPDATAAPPAQQVSAALVSLARAPDGGQRMTLRLEPAELGQVQIRIDRPQDAPAQVEITVQRPETLTLLLRDQPQLQRALDQAGVPADGRSLTLHIAAPQSAAPPGSATSGAAVSADPGQGGGNGAGTRSGGQGQSANTSDADQDDTPASLPRWLRAGLDITA